MADPVPARSRQIPMTPSVRPDLLADLDAGRPRMTAAALRRWLPILVRRAPHLATAYLVPGRVHPRLR